jgi:hypothetical protein
MNRSPQQVEAIIGELCSIRLYLQLLVGGHMSYLRN